MNGRGWKSGFVALSAAVATVLSVSPAQADYPGNSDSYGTTFVDGDGTLTDDFGDHFEELGNSLCYGCGESSNTDIVMLWQSILVAEHYLDFHDVDGDFGSKTKAATIQWQRSRGLDADGMVGDATWSRADDRLVWVGSTVRYKSAGLFGFVELHRGDSDKYHDGGAYHLHKVMQGDGVDVYTSSGTRIFHRVKTIS
ncbi:peptidoglycan-binding protein [Actinosynnema sp. NPDC050801]|uniref:peptidoglycan-binding domain-containing protein n=1 Tax=unclassified Actinosynnema TaxID=2637065 RepID=UPI0033EBBA75